MKWIFYFTIKPTLKATLFQETCRFFIYFTKKNFSFNFLLRTCRNNTLKLSINRSHLEVMASNQYVSTP